VRPDAYEAVFGALAHPARRRVLLAIYFNGGRFSCGALERRESRNSGSAVFAQGFAGYVTQF
jgi:hypothetical protein